MTDRERELIAGAGDDSIDDDLRYQAVSRVRRKIQAELAVDAAILNAYHGELARELRAVVCPEPRDETDR